jgi:hypothetical protein
MVLFGYEPGSAAYRVYDPFGGHVHISRDMVFDEGARWDWEKTSGTPDAPSFHVEHFSFPMISTATFPAAIATTSMATSSAARAASEPTTPSMSGDAGGGGSSPASCMASPTSASTSTMPTPPHQLHPMTTRVRDGIVQPNPRFNDYVMIIDDELAEYDELCLIAAEEPADVDAALNEACWKSAMDAELNLIRSNGTWELSTLPTGH